MKEFNYTRAWAEAVHPAFLGLSQEIRDAYTHTTGEAGIIKQEGSSHQVTGASADLLKRFDALEPVSLAWAGKVCYYLGHLAIDRMWNDKGQGWKFEMMADQSLIKRGFALQITSAETQMKELLKPYHEHKEGTTYDDEEVAELLKLEVGKTADFKSVVMSCCCVNFKPHPFCIGQSHFPKDGAMYLNPHQAGCEYQDNRHSKKCGLPYEDHTHDRVVFIRPNDPEDKDAISADLLICKTIIEAHEIKVDGFALVANEGYEGRRVQI